VTARPHVRSRGTHLSEIIQRINKESGRLKEQVIFGRNTYDALDEDDLPACMFLGFCVESMLVRMHPWIQRYGELSSDGIAMSPDGVTFNSRRHLLSPHEPVDLLHEIKATWKSSKSLLEEKVNYLQQMKSYCRALGTNFAILHVFFVVGDYRFGDGGGPLLRQYHIEFSPFEIESNWCEILKKKKDFGL
jgi:hypothetical protein